MKLSHSKLSLILSCPMSYYLRYEQKISKVETKPALAIGSAVHWGIEHNTDDLTEYFNTNGGFKTRDSFGREQILSEAMCFGYLKHKDEIFEQILTDPTTGEKLDLLDETHELDITAKLKSNLPHIEHHEFVGIIDLLLLTQNGFIVVDYKTSTYEPNWDDYLEQLYKYIFLLRDQFPDVPIVKIAIINIRKAGIRQKKNENTEQFYKRLQQEYDWNDENYVNYHEFPLSTINPALMNEYLDNLSKMADAAQMIVDNKMFYINYGAANGQYGHSDYWDIFYGTKNAEILYQISDKLVNPDSKTEDDKFLKYRPCVDIDMLVCTHKNVLNKYSIFKNELDKANGEFNEAFLDALYKKYTVNDNLLQEYIDTYTLEQSLKV